MNYTEEVARFPCANESLMGIVALPDHPVKTGVVVIVGGPQYRVGSHRQFVLLSRTLAQAGYPVLRFDHRGMGDSTGQARDFQCISVDIEAAIDTLQRHAPTVQHVALWGLCDGASAALLYCFDTRDPRVRALCLLNPWVRSSTSLARSHIKHYYRHRWKQAEFWKKFLHGEIGINALGDLLQSLQRGFYGQPDTAEKAEPTFQQRMALAWDTFSGSIFLLLSEDDYTAKEFLEHAATDLAWKNTLHHPHLVRHELQGADHTFSSAVYRTMAETLTLQQGLPPPCEQADVLRD